MGDGLSYRIYRTQFLPPDEAEKRWLNICKESHDLMCRCGDWQVHFQFALQTHFGSQWHLTAVTKSGEDEGMGTSGGHKDTGDIDSDLECAAAAAAVEVDTAGPDDTVLR